MDIRKQTQNVANQGRYGDSMLLHVNPAEVKGLAQAMPITVNPETGQPEAFLPFLAPLLGSMAGTTFLTGLGGAGVVGAGISSALAAGLGAGAATYLESGGSGKKALLSGLTAGFGTSAANTGAQAAQTSSDIATGVAGGMSPEIAAQTAAAAAPRTPTSFLGSARDMFKQGVDATGVADGSFAFDQGAKSLATGLMSPSGMVAGASLGTQGVINSQELFEQQMRELEMDEEQRKRDMYANNPEVQLYSASGGMTNFEGGGNTDYQSNKMQVYAPVKTQYQVNPDFMAGFAPETMYFRPDTINSPSMSTLGGSVPKLGADTYTGTKGGYDYEGTVDADGNYTAGTAQGVQFAPQTSIDPYAAFTGSAPQGLVQSAYNPYPVQPMSMSPIDDTEDTSDYTDAGGIGEDGDGYVDVINITDGDGTIISEDGGVSVGPNVGIGPNTGISAQDLINNYVESQGVTTDVLTGNNPEILDSFNTANLGFNPTLDLGIDASIADAMGGNNMGMSGNAEINPTAYSPFSQDFYRPQNVDYYEDVLDFNTTFNDGPRGKATGGDTDKKMPNKGLEALNKVAPDAVANMGYQEGGQTDPLIQEVTMFILGESDNEQIVNQFVDKYGVEAFTQLREQILQSLVPNAQTSGLIEGIGNGGMDDDIMGTIGNQEKIAVSQDEFIVPADVVSMLGDGSSDAGSKELYDMMDRVRQEKTGTTKQAPKLANAGGMLPA